MCPLIIAIFVFIFNIFLLIFPQVVLPASREGLLLWFNNVLPSMLPFMIATNMLISLGFAQTLGNFISPIMKNIFKLPGSGGFALIIGLTSGYPLGAKVVADLHRNEQISTDEAQHLLGFCNNAGPLFIVGVVGIGMFESASVGYLLWASHALSAILLGVILGWVKKAPVVLPKGSVAEVSPAEREHTPIKKEPIGKIMGEAVKNAMEAMALVGGLIIFFSVVVALIDAIAFPDDVSLGGLMAGLIEVTGGLNRLAIMHTTPQTLAIVAFVIAFGGFSIHMQTFHFTTGTGIRPMPYLLSKIAHGLIAILVIMILSYIVNT